MLCGGKSDYGQGIVLDMAKRVWLSYAMVGISGAAAAVVGLLGATALSPPSTLSEPNEATSAPVTLIEFRDERLAGSEIEAAQPGEATLGIAGTVTSSECVQGGELTSGTIVASINGEPIIGLNTDVPFYRDIGPEAEGSDVDALRRQLAAAGYEVGPEGVYGPDLQSALIEMQVDLGSTDRDGVLRHQKTLWLAAPKVRVQTCNALLGSSYSPGSPFITTVGDLQSLRIIFPLDQPPAPGERDVIFGDLSAPVSADGLVLDSALLAEVARSQEFAAAQTSSSPQPLTFRTALRTSLEVARVPVSGVSSVTGNKACVRSSDNTNHPVTIIGSSAGSVLTTFEGQVPTDVLLGATGSNECQN